LFDRLKFTGTKRTASAEEKSNSSGSSIDPMNPASQQHVVCVRNDGMPVSLELRKIYETLPDPDAENSGMVRVVDESGEDYLYPAAWFVPITLSFELKSALRLAS
jgi:hypothetical protein